MQHKANRFSNKGKIIASLLLLSLATGAGSLAGTLAWYQYSTIASASYIATTAKASELLQIKAGDGEWKSVLETKDIKAAQGETGTNIVPVTAGNQAKDEALNTLKATPRYQVPDPANWGDAPASSYLQFTLSFRVQNGEGGALQKDAPLYFSDIAFKDEAGLSDSLRIHVANETESKNFLIARSDATIDTHGNLDLNGDGASDTAKKYEWESASEPLDYGLNGTETAYLPSEMVASDNSGSLSGGELLGTIPSGGTLSLTFTIFVEGWEKLSDSAIWDSASLGGAGFGVGFSFIIPKLV